LTFDIHPPWVLLKPKPLTIRILLREEEIASGRHRDYSTVQIGANSSGLSAARHQKAGQKMVKSWSKGGQKVDKSWSFWGILGVFEGF